MDITNLVPAHPQTGSAFQLGRLQNSALRGFITPAVLLLLGMAGAFGTTFNAAQAAAGDAPDQAQASCCTVEATAAAQAKLAAALIQGLAKNTKRTDENFVVAPASLAATFETLALGADEAMNAALIQTLQYKAKADHGLSQTIFESLGKAEDGLVKDASETVQIANRVILDPSIKPYPVVLKGLAAMGREIAKEDLSNPEAVARANDWIKEKTHGMIPSILDGPLSKPALTILNALHFKANWARRFDSALTKPHPFTDVAGKAHDVMMMKLTEGKYSYREESGFTAVDLPFAEDRFSLVLVTTTGKPAPASTFAAAAPFLDGSNFNLHAGEIEMPRLKLSGGNNLLPVLNDLGLAQVGGDANALGGFAPNIHLGRILQRVEMSADEEGAEASAATAVTTTRSFEGNPIHLVFDKPFIFALRDRQTGLILAAGYVSKPAMDEGGNGG